MDRLPLAAAGAGRVHKAGAASLPLPTSFLAADDR